MNIYLQAVICIAWGYFIGSINPSNRENNLNGLKKLLESIVLKYPAAAWMDVVLFVPKDNIQTPS